MSLTVFTIYFISSSPAFAQEIIITNIQTNPSQVHVGDSFRINATIVNNSPDTINFNGGCLSPLSATFDNNVSVGQAMGCLAIYKVVLNPGENTTVVGPGSANLYAATSSGTTNANVTFAYHATNNTENIVSKTFTFDISQSAIIPEFPSMVGIIFAIATISTIVMVSKRHSLG
ncbi:MAG: hypothetical protein KGI28_00060 [Thaumarchaeota archaeon]|nr:hypothetical protein [Nitrososphaerota archaeon]